MIGGSGSADRLEVTLGSSPETVTLSASSNGFMLFLPGAQLAVSGIEICDLETGGGADTVVLNALSASQLGEVNLNLGVDSARDMVSIVGTSGTDVYSLTVASGAVEIARSGGTAVTINQAGSSHGGSILTIDMGDGNDSLDVLATLAGASTGVYAGAGDDTIRIGAAGNVNGIVEGILIDGQAGSDTLDVFDGDQDGPETVSLSPTNISGLDMVGDITYGGIEFLNLLLGSRPDTVNVLGTNASTITAIYGGEDNDTFNVGPTAGGAVHDLTGKVILEGQGGWDTLNLDDSNAPAAQDGTLTTTTIRGLGMDEGIDYYGLESLDMLLSGGTLLIDGTVPMTTVITTAGFITVQTALAPAGSIFLDAAGGIAAGQVEAHTLNLETLGDIADLAGSLQAQDVTLTAAGGITLRPVICQELNATAGGSIDLETEAGALEAVAGGDIVVEESDSIVLRSLTSVAGSITVKTAGSITAQSVTAAADVILVAGGNITDTDLPGSIQGVKVHLSAAGSIVVGPVVAGELAAEAGGAMNLETEVGSIEATAGGDLVVTENDAILLSWLGSTAGSVTVAAGGTITAQEVAGAEAVTLEASAGIDDPGHILVQGSILAETELILTAAADILIADSAALAANPDSGTAFLTAGGIVHSQSDIPVLAHTLQVSAGRGIHLSTEVSVLDAVVAGAGDIWIQENDGVVLSEVVATDGAIRIITGDTIEARSVACLTDRPGASVALLALQGDILIDTIAVGVEFGQMSLCATTGDIREVDDFDAGTDLSGHLGILYAAGQIGSVENPDLNLESELGDLIEVTGPNFDLHIDGDVELFFLISGRIRVTATGTIRVLYLESITGDIWLKACQDIEVDFASAGDDLWLWAGDSILVSEDTVWGDAGIMTASDDLSLWAKHDITVAGALSAGDDACLVAEYGDVVVSASISAGDDLSLYAKRGNMSIEGAIAAGGDVSIDVHRGDLSFVGTITGGDDISIDVHCGDMTYIGTVAAGDDVCLEASNLSVSGTITTGGDVKLRSGRGDVIFEGTIDAGEDVCIWSNLDPLIMGTIQAGWDIEIWSDTDVLVDGSLIAGHDVFLSSCRSDVRVIGVIKAGDDVTLRASRGNLSIDGSIAAGDDVSIDVHRGDLIFIGAITVGDDVSIDVYCGDMVLTGMIEAGDDVSIKAGHGAITATGSISAGDDIEIRSYRNLVFGGNRAAGDRMMLRSIRGKVLLT